jgi:Family of unknown function (DUF5946)
MTAEPRIACIGCGGLVPDFDGPSHRYMLASPGCWAAYGRLLGGALAGIELPSPHGSLTVDAYAVQHPGVPNPQATQSVWVHLVTLQLALEADWPPSQFVRIRRFGADSSTGLTWLEPPLSMGPVTAIDVAEASPETVAGTVRTWVKDAWTSWHDHHDAVRARATRLVQRLG